MQKLTLSIFNFNMRVFFAKLLSLGLVIAMSTLLIGIITRPEESRSLGVTIAKHRVLQQMASPKIVLIGGSNLAFGVDSARLQQELNTNVFNLGLNVYFGLKFHLDEIRPYVRSGDLIVISPEYHLFYIDALKLIETDYIMPSVIHATFPRSAVYFPIRDQLSALLIALNRLPSRIGDRIRQIPSGPDLTFAYNYLGDFIDHLNVSVSDQIRINNADSKAPTNINWRELSFDQNSIQYLNQFDEFVRARGARVVMVYPPWPSHLYQLDPTFYQDHHAQLSQRLHIPILGTPDRYVYPTEHMFDSPYHVDAIWRQERSKRLIEDLQPLIH